MTREAHERERRQQAAFILSRFRHGHVGLIETDEEVGPHPFRDGKNDPFVRMGVLLAIVAAFWVFSHLPLLF